MKTIEHLNNPPPSVNLEPMSPEAFLQHFVASFFDKFSGENPSGYYSALRNNAVEGAWWRGHAQGKLEGYAQAMLEMKDTITSSGDFIQKLKS